MQTSGQERELQALRGTLAFERLVSQSAAGGVYSCGEWPESAQVLLAVALAHYRRGRGWLVVVESVREQEEMAAELEAWGEKPLLIPEMHRGGEGVRPDPDLEAEWLGALGTLVGKERPALLIVTQGVLRAKQPDPETVRKGLCKIRVGEELDPLQLVEDLVRAGYRSVGTVTERGEVARRGGIVDLFPTQSDVPVRMEWGGDRLESIRQIDLHEQVGVGEVGEVTIFLGQAGQMSCRSDFREYLGDGWGTLTCMAEGEGQRLENPFTRHGLASEPMRDAGLAEARRRRVGAEVKAWLARGWRVVLSGINEGESDRLKSWLEECGLSKEEVGKLEFVISGLSKGIAWPEAKWVILSGAEILGRTETGRGYRRGKNLAGEKWKRPVFDSGELKLGDYAVHLQHGVAIYEGLGDKPGGLGQCLLLQYANGGRLYVPVEESYLVSRYVGVGKKRPTLDTLGGGRWEKARAKAEKAVEEFAATLL